MNEVSRRDEATSHPGRPAIGPAAAAAGFVGIEACQECHAERAAEFVGTRHYLACCTPDTVTMPRGFESGRGDFVTRRDSDVRFEMSRNSNDYFLSAIRATPAGDQRKTSSIDLVYGAQSGTDEVFFSWHGDALVELPIVWLHPLDDWGASPFSVDQATDVGRALTPQCIECHNTWFEHQPGAVHLFNRADALLGVTCERCHGPGRDHVAFHRANPGTRTGQQIVRPAQLSRERQLDLCGQCHTNTITYRKAPFSYRPGKPLDEYFRVLVTRHPEDDHVANQMRYMRESRCFLESETLTCTTCHDPHRPREAQNVAAQRAACVSCHAPADCGERKRLPAPVQDECVRCHMPKRNKIQVNFQTRTTTTYFPVQRCEHRIAVYADARDEVLRDWHASQSDAASRAVVERLNRALADDWRAQGESCQREYRFLAAIDAFQQAQRFDPSQDLATRISELKDRQWQLKVGWSTARRLRAEGRLPAAIDQLEELLKIKPDDATAHAELGTLYAMVGQRGPAEEHLRTAAACDPDSPSGPAMLGWLSYLDDRPEEALEHYRAAESVEPYNARLQYNMGLALSRLERWDEAAGRFRSVIGIEPRHAAGCQGLSQALRQLGNAAEALRWAAQAVELSAGRDAGMQLTLAEAYAAAGDNAAAQRVAQQALAQLPDQTRPPAPGIREFLQQLRERASDRAPSASGAPGGTP